MFMLKFTEEVLTDDIPKSEVLSTIHTVYMFKEMQLSNQFSSKNTFRKINWVAM
ncbi:hypothetical protein C0J52_21068 [Blattella germanica]|nr:hypothetical protein C0J52_21068 [Blattella germanica]